MRQLLATDTGLATRADDDERTPLHFAAAHGHVDVCSVLVSAGAGVNAADEDGETPLHYASQLDHGAVVGFLLERGADIEARNAYGRTPLLLVARESGKVDMARLLLERGADVNARDRFAASARRLERLQRPGEPVPRCWGGVAGAR